MATVVKYPLNDRGLGYSKLQQGEHGWDGERYALIGTADEHEAVLSTPVKIGDPWSQNLPFCRAVLLSGNWWRGPGSGNGVDLGHTVVKIDYRTVIVNGRLPPPTPGQSYTQLGGSDESIQQYYDARLPLPSPPLNNGDGFPRMVGTVEAKVTVWHPLGTVFDLPRLISLKRLKPANDSPITLPQVLGTGTPLNLGTDQVRYQNFDGPYRRENNVLEMVHTVLLAPDHRVRWQRRNAVGEGVANVESNLYGLANLGGLW